MGTGTGGLVVEGLTRRYRGNVVVDDVSFSVPAGTVSGFIGPNGSGKSTTLRMIVDHSQADSGRALFDGSPFSRLSVPGRHVGVLLDASAQHPGRSVLETALLAGILVGVGRARVLACLEAVGVDTVARRRVGALSLGMRQRLGIAIAVLGSPRFLILDEPANGLDPEGIHWLQRFLRQFADAGGTALVSSHQLGEIDAAADDIIVIDRGRRVDASVFDRASSPRTRAASTDPERLVSALSARGLVVTREDRVVMVEAPPGTVGSIALAAGVPLTHLAAESRSLEAEFLRATSGEFAGLAGDGLADLVQGGRS